MQQAARTRQPSGQGSCCLAAVSGGTQQPASTMKAAPTVAQRALTKLSAFEDQLSGPSGGHRLRGQTPEAAQ